MTKNKPKRILISGFSGFVGRRLSSFLKDSGFEVLGLSRNTNTARSIQWDPESGELPASVMDGVDVVINLAGANIASGRWTAKRKELIRSSRLQSTRKLIQAIGRSDSRPSTLISMSGVNFYNPGKQVSSESDPVGDAFLSRLCFDWEAEAMLAQEFGVRSVVLRLGVVLDSSGGALAKMLPIFRLGLGGPLGSGDQGFPWVGMPDLLNIILFVINSSSLSGPICVTHPSKITQGEFAQILARSLSRPAFLRLPEWLIRLVFGQMGKETLLCDLNVFPEKLVQYGFEFGYDNLNEFLQEELSGK